MSFYHRYAPIERLEDDSEPECEENICPVCEQYFFYCPGHSKDLPVSVK